MKIRDGVKLAIGLYIGRIITSGIDAMVESLTAVAVVKYDLVPKDDKLYEHSVDYLRRMMPNTYSILKSYK